MPRISWSISRDQVLHTCERRYYFQYVAGARSNSRSELLREIALLKRLQTLPAWRGRVFHDVIAGWLRHARNGRELPMELLLQDAVERATQDWAESMAPSTGQKSFRLFEHEYGVALPPNTPAKVADEVGRWIAKFRAWAEETGLADSIVQARQVWIEPPTYGAQAPGFELDGVQVLVKVDLAATFTDGRFEIWDWKTGRPSNDNPYRVDPATLQVNVYQLWPHLRLTVPLEKVRAHLVYVASEPVQHRSFLIDDDVREYALSVVRRSVNQVKHLASEHGGESLGLEDFDYATNVALCRSCSFKRLCWRSVEGVW